MYICLCNNVTDRQIRESVNRGADTLPAVQRHLPVATCCGRCEDTAVELIETERTRKGYASVAA
jgi:bacterioferritin-associated ferredoxin